jgi:hypothetical protein
MVYFLPMSREAVGFTQSPVESVLGGGGLFPCWESGRGVKLTTRPIVMRLKIF